MALIHIYGQPNYNISSASDNNCQGVAFLRGGGGVASMKHPCRAGPDQAFWCADGGVLLCLPSEQSWIDEDALLSEVSVSLQSHYVSGCIFLLSGRPPPFPIPTSPPVCQPGTAPSSSSVYPLYLNAFLQGRLLFIPSGGLTVNLLHWREISGNGARISGYPASAPRSGDPLYTFMYLSSYLFIRTTIQRHTPPLLSAFFSSLVLFSGMNIWPGFNFLSFPATANWKTPLKSLLIAKK